MNDDQNKLIKQETGIDISPEGELAVSMTTATAIQEVQGMIIVAKRFPRNYDSCWQKLQKACKRKTLAEKACYSYPRSGHTIMGPSINLARVAGQCYGNLRWGIDILRDDEDSRTIRGWAWDIEENIQVSAQDSFKKLIYRKVSGWIKPDERDLRELTNRRGAILIRNCLFNVLPRDYIEDAVGQTRLTLKSEIRDPDSEKKHIISKFIDLRITVEQINEYLGHDQWTLDDIVELKGMLFAISDGTAKVEDYFFAEESKRSNGTLTEKDMTAGTPETKTPERLKRKRRTKAEMEEARKAEEESKTETPTEHSRELPSEPATLASDAQIDAIKGCLDNLEITDDYERQKAASEAARLEKVRSSFLGWTSKEAQLAFVNLQKYIGGKEG